MKDASVSEKHGEIKYDGERWLIVDTNSSNGTMINGVACTPKGTDVQFAPNQSLIWMHMYTLACPMDGARDWSPSAVRIRLFVSMSFPR